MTQCEQIKHDIDYYGIDTVVDKYTRKGYNVGSYKAPGTTEQKLWKKNTRPYMYTACTHFWMD